MLRTEGKNFLSNDQNASLYLFCYAYEKFVVYCTLFEYIKHGCLLITYDVRFSHNT